MTDFILYCLFSLSIQKLIPFEVKGFFTDFYVFFTDLQEPDRESGKNLTVLETHQFTCKGLQLGEAQAEAEDQQQFSSSITDLKYALKNKMTPIHRRA